MKTRCQVAVVGAGPAGGYAALTAAREGLDVLLLERDAEVGRPLCCAEAISVMGLESFVKPDPVFISTTIEAISFAVSTGYEYTYRPKDQLGYILHRPVFDRHLAELAVEAGAELRTRTHVSGIELNAGGPATLTIETEAGSEQVAADYVIGADGVESMIGRMAGIKTLLKLTQTDSCLQYRVSGIEIDPACMRFFVGHTYSPDGYLWVFPKDGRSANIGLGLCPGKNDNARLRELLDRFMAERFPGGVVEAVSCGMVPKYIGLKPIGRDNLLLAGDAARLIDSLTGAGIAKAMHTGKLAAEAVVGATQGEVSRAKLVATYRKRLSDELGVSLKFFEVVHRIFRKFDDMDWENLVSAIERYLAKEKAGSIDPAVLVRTALTGSPRLLRLARHLF